MPGRNFTQAAADLRSTLDGVAQILGLDIRDSCVQETEELLQTILTRDPEAHRLVTTLMTARLNWSRLQDEIEASSKQGFLSNEERHDLARLAAMKHEAAHALAAHLKNFK